MATKNLGIVLPPDGDINWGDTYRSAMSVLDASTMSHYFAEDEPFDGLNFRFKSGVYRKGEVVNVVNAGSVLCTDNTVNYIFLITEGEIGIFTNTTGFPTGSIPLFEVTTLEGDITEVNDIRTLLVVVPPKEQERKAITFYIGKDLAVDDIASVICPFNMEIENVRMAVDVAPAGSDLIVDLLIDDVSAFTTVANRPTITAGQTSCVSVAPDIVNVAEFSKLSLKVIQKGSSTAGKNLTISVLGLV